MYEVPPEPNFVLNESHGDWRLLSLLVRREKLIDIMSESGGRDAALTRNDYYAIGEEIRGYKVRNDIPLRPLLTPNDIETLESWVEEPNT